MDTKPIRILDKDRYYDWKEWQAADWDEHSLVADPILIEIKRPDLGLKPGSPAFRIGFRQIDMSNTGLLKKNNN